MYSLYFNMPDLCPGLMLITPHFLYQQTSRKIHYTYNTKTKRHFSQMPTTHLSDYTSYIVSNFEDVQGGLGTERSNLNKFVRGVGPCAGGAVICFQNKYAFQ